MIIRFFVVLIDNQNSFIIFRENWFLLNNEFFKKLKETSLLYIYSVFSIYIFLYKS